MDHAVALLLFLVVVASNAENIRICSESEDEFVLDESSSDSIMEFSSRISETKKPSRFAMLLEKQRIIDKVLKKLNKTTPATFSPGHIALGSPAALPQSDTDDDGGVPNVVCSSDGGNCSCTFGYVGTPPECRPGQKLWAACFKDNPCGLNSECEIDSQGTRLCACMRGFIGCPPQCEPGPKYKARCSKCGKNTECDDSGVKAICYCLPWFVGEYDSHGNLPSCTPGPELLARCRPYTCGPYADCHSRGGVRSCSCLPGYDGEPPNCRPSPELWRVCFKHRPCGPHSLCAMKDDQPVCMPCSDGYSGTPPFCYKP